MEIMLEMMSKCENLISIDKIGETKKKIPINYMKIDLSTLNPADKNEKKVALVVGGLAD